MNSSCFFTAPKVALLVSCLFLFSFERFAIAAPYQDSIGTTIDTYLSDLQSPLTSNGSVFLEQGVRWNVDPRLVVAIAGQEQDFGRAGSSCDSVYNAWSWFYDNLRCPQAAFSSWSDGIQTVTKYLSESYFKRYHATTISAIGKIYCTEACGDWAANVTTFYAAHLGGDTNDLTFSRSSNQTPTFFSDSFELYTPGMFPSSGGWFIRSGAEGIGGGSQFVASTRANAGAQSLQLSSAQGLGVNVQRLFTPPAHPYALEAYINTTRTDSKNAFIGFGNADSVNAGVRFVSGRGIAVLNSETVPSTVIAFGGGYDADIWIKLRIVVDPATNTYAVYKNNVLATQGLSAAAPTGQTDRVWIGVDNSGVDVVGGTTAYFDDVSVIDVGP